MFHKVNYKWLPTLCAVFLFATSALASAETTVGTTELEYAQPFSDLVGNPVEEEVVALYSQGAVRNDGSSLFRPDQPITRAELITMIISAKKIEPVTNQQSQSFDDVSSRHWLFPYAETAYRLGIVHGSQSGNRLLFQPNKEVKQQEFMNMLLSAMGQGGRINQLNWSTTMQTLQNYSDGNQVVDWAQRPIAFALQNNILTPSSEGTIQPNKSISRGEAAHYIYNLLLTPSLQKTLNDSTNTPRFNYVRTLQVQTTAFHDVDTNPHAFIGWPTRVGTVAVDPNVIKLGSHLYIEGYGYAVAADIGGAVKKNHVDLFLPTLQKAQAYGLKQDVKVYVLD